MEASRLLELLMHGNQLKRTPRTGWGQRGVPAPEDVAAHSYGVVYTTLVLAQLVERPLRLDVALAMAALHDLPEGLTTDMPPSAWRLLPEGAKAAAERGALAQIFGDAPFAPELMSLWEEYRQNETAEAQLVHDADKLDQFLQAYIYEQQTGNQQLSEFWANPHRFHLPEAQAVYDELYARRANMRRGV